jgi:2-C-methyl-D-erythritol 2,4-cyclodiphosphate synthase
VREKVEGEGWSVINADLTLLGETPKIAPHVTAMRSRLAGSLNVAADAVAVKATTLERLGALGRREGLAGMAVVLLGRP